MEKNIFLGIGGNIGDVKETLAQAKQFMQEEGIQLYAESSFYRTAPFGPVEQDDFLNQVIQVQSDLEPVALLEACLAIENRLGRVRTIKWGPRTVDIDLLFYGQQQMETDNLILPHPGIAERAFVLVPLAEIAPNFVHPGLQKTIQDLRNELEVKPGEIKQL